MIPLPPGEPRQLAALYRTLSRLISAGIPPVQRAVVLREHPHGPHAAKAADILARAFAAGALPSRALSSSRAVPPHHVALIAAGETSGALDIVFDKLASACEQEARLRAQGWRLALEPLVAWLVIAVIGPAPRLVMSGWVAYLSIALPLLAVLPLFVVVLQGSRRGFGAVPGFGEASRLLAAARACRTIALFNAAGLPLPRTLRAGADAAAHAEITPRLQRAAATVEAGSTLDAALREQEVLRPVELALVADGELTGRLDVAFERAAGLLEHEGFGKAQWRLRVAGAIAFALLAIYTAFNLAGAFAGIGSVPGT